MNAELCVVNENGQVIARAAVELEMRAGRGFVSGGQVTVRVTAASQSAHIVAWLPALDCECQCGVTGSVFGIEERPLHPGDDVTLVFEGPVISIRGDW